MSADSFLDDEDYTYRTAICTTPDDDTVRLTYADWLDQNDRWPGLAEFIRLQIAVAACCTTTLDDEVGGPTTVRPVGDDESELRASRLWGQHGPAWLVGSPLLPFDDLTDSTSRCYWRRGFVNHVRITWEDWARLAYRIAWRSDWRVDCPQCSGHGCVPSIDYGFTTCPTCDGRTQTLLRRDPGAHPIRSVFLTTRPGLLAGPLLAPKESRLCSLMVGESAQSSRPATRQHLVDFVRYPDVAEDRIIASVLKQEWPGITFHLPGAP